MTRWRSTLAVVAVMAVAVSAGCAGEEEMSSSTDASPTTPAKPPPKSSTTTTTTTMTPTTTTSTTTTTTTTAPTTTSPEQARAAAQGSWPDLVRAHGGSQLLHATGMRGLQPIGVMVPEAPDYEGPMTIWVYDGDRWIVETQLDNGGDPFRYASQVTMVDLTGDGNDEIYLDITPNAPAVMVFRDSPFGWGEVYTGTRISREGTRMTGYEQFCLWDCETLVLDIEVVWDGDRFVEYHVDFFGNRVQLRTERTCPRYQDRDTLPLQLCDQGYSVYVLQDALYILGALDSSPTGMFDQATDYAVRVYQVLVGAPVNGVVDGLWYQELMNAYLAGLLPSRR